MRKEEDIVRKIRGDLNDLFEETFTGKLQIISDYYGFLQWQRFNLLDNFLRYLICCNTTTQSAIPSKLILFCYPLEELPADALIPDEHIDDRYVYGGYEATIFDPYLMPEAFEESQIQYFSENLPEKYIELFFELFIGQYSEASEKLTIDKLRKIYVSYQLSNSES